MMRLWIGCFLALMASASFASTGRYVSRDGVVRAVVHLPDGGRHMGAAHGTGELYIGRHLVAPLDCAYSSGITVTLDCSGQGYLLSAAGNLSRLHATFPSGRELILFQE